MNGFSAILHFLFGWLPSDLYTLVIGVVMTAFLVIVVRILVALVQLISKAVLLFLGA